jgi:hypothetical protein
MNNYNRELWNEVVQSGGLVDTGETNNFDESDINTVIALLDYFNASNIFMKQTYFDLKVAKFRLFDWLAMAIMGRNDDDRERNNTCIKVLVYAIRKAEYNPTKLIDILRVEDFDLDTGWRQILVDTKEEVSV